MFLAFYIGYIGYKYNNGPSNTMTDFYNECKKITTKMIYKSINIFRIREKDVSKRPIESTI